MTEEELVDLDTVPHLRRLLWKCLLLTDVKLVGLGLAGGSATAVAVYFLKFRNGDFTVPIIVGMLMSLSLLPNVIHWTRHFLAFLRQLSEIEARVRRGEVIHVSELQFRSYR
jgi:hypothetical protein